MTGDAVGPRGFTLIEMIVVMATIALLLALAVPNYLATLDRGKEQVLQQNIALMREALDKHYGDTGKYPDRLEDLVTRRYLRAIPLDPFTESATWVVVTPKDPAMGGVLDVRSTMTDRDRQPRAAASSPATAVPGMPPAPAEDAGGLVAREGGAVRTVTVQASAPTPAGRTAR